MFVMSAHFIGASSVKSNIVFTKTTHGQAPTSTTIIMTWINERKEKMNTSLEKLFEELSRLINKDRGAR